MWWYVKLKWTGTVWMELNMKSCGGSSCRPRFSSEARRSFPFCRNAWLRAGVSSLRKLLLLVWAQRKVYVETLELHQTSPGRDGMILSLASISPASMGNISFRALCGTKRNVSVVSDFRTDVQTVLKTVMWLRLLSKSTKNKCSQLFTQLPKVWLTWKVCISGYLL